MKLSINKVLTAIESTALTFEAKLNGISYYLGDSDEDYIIAVDHENKLAIRTNFCEMDDFYDVTIDSVTYKSDYAIVNSGGVLMSSWEAE